MLLNPHLFVITGGPGTGKTTLLEELQKRGFPYIPETARQVIKEQLASNGNALPWEDTEAYTRLMLSGSVNAFLLHKDIDTTFFSDRGIPDTLAYARLINSGIETEAEEKAQDYRYNPLVFILPPWEEIYDTDTERKQTFEEAVSTYRIIRETYTYMGYRPEEVPRQTTGERADFILSAVKELKKIL